MFSLWKTARTQNCFFLPGRTIYNNHMWEGWALQGILGSQTTAQNDGAVSLSSHREPTTWAQLLGCPTASLLELSPWLCVNYCHWVRSSPPYWAGVCRKQSLQCGGALANALTKAPTDQDTRGVRTGVPMPVKREQILAVWTWNTRGLCFPSDEDVMSMTTPPPSPPIITVAANYWQSQGRPGTSYGARQFVCYVSWVS